jgi:hypothetical protein
MIEYVILATSHCIQDSSEFAKPLTESIEKHAAQLVTEEYPFPGIPSTAQRIATHVGRECLQIDPLPAEWYALGILRKNIFLRIGACKTSCATALTFRE